MITYFTKINLHCESIRSDSAEFLYFKKRVHFIEVFNDTDRKAKLIFLYLVIVREADAATGEQRQSRAGIAHARHGCDEGSACVAIAGDLTAQCHHSCATNSTTAGTIYYCKLNQYVVHRL